MCPATGPPTFSMCYVNREAESAWGVNSMILAIDKMDQGLKKDNKIIIADVARSYGNPKVTKLREFKLKLPVCYG